MYFSVNIFFHTCKLEVPFQSGDSCSSSLGNILLFCWWSTPPPLYLWYSCLQVRLLILVSKLFSLFFPVFFLFVFSFFLSFFFFFLYFGHIAWRICWFPNQESKLGLHNWKHQILTTRQPGNFLSFLCAFWNFSSVSVSSSFCIFYQVFNFCFHIFNFQEMVSVLLSVLFL